MKRLTVCTLLLLYVFSLLAVSAFAAKASKVPDADQATWVPAETREGYLFDTHVDASALSKPSGFSSSSLGYLASPGFQIGETSYDLQQNSDIGRQIAVGTDGRIHFIWTWKAPAAGERQIRYGSYVPGVGFSDLPGGLAISDGREGHMCGLSNYNSRALATWRPGATFAVYGTTSGIDFAPGAGSFTIVDPPYSAPSCEGVYSGAVQENWIWPRIVADYDGGGG